MVEQSRNFALCTRSGKVQKHIHLFFSLCIWRTQAIRCDPDHVWSVGYDKSQDRGCIPIATFVVANPNPLCFDISGTGAIGFNGAAQQYEKYKKVLTELKKVDDKFNCSSFVTDNENTMKALRKLVREDGGTSTGCGSHAMNKAMGMLCINT